MLPGWVVKRPKPGAASPSQPVKTQVSSVSRRTGAAPGAGGRGGAVDRWGISGRANANKRGSRVTSGCPQGAGPVVGLTLSNGTAYRWAVEPVSTGAACPRSLRRPAAARLRPCPPRGAPRMAPADGRCQPTPRVRSNDLVTRTVWENSREQAYVPAEQPSSSQGARLPPADAHPRRPLDPVLAPPQGSQQARRLTATRMRLVSCLA